MSQKLIRPELTAATAVVRQLLAAGWRPRDAYNAYKVSDGVLGPRTVLIMRRGPQEIVADVLDDDSGKVDLELTGLSMDQAMAVARLFAAPAAEIVADSDYVEAVQVALADAGVTVYYSGVGKSFADLWLTPPGATPPGERDGVVLKWLPSGWQMVQLAGGKAVATSWLGLSPTATPAAVARRVAARMAIEDQPGGAR